MDRREENQEIGQAQSLRFLSQLISLAALPLMRALSIALPVALILVGLYIASYIRKAVRSLFESLELSGSKIISNLVFYAIVLIVSVTALNQAGVDTTIITGNVTLILGAMLLAVALGFGLGSRDIFTALLRGFYTRKTYVAGDKISIRKKKIEGTIESIDSISVVIRTSEGKTVIPMKDIVEHRVDIKS